VRRSTAAFSLALLAALLASACEPGDPLEGGVASATLSFRRADTRDDGVEALELDVVAAVVFTARTPEEPRRGAACDAPGGVRHTLAVPVAVDLTAETEPTIGRIAVQEEELGRLVEIRLLVRAARVDAGELRAGHGRMTCRDGEEERILLRLVPAERIDLERDRDHALAAELHAEGDGEREVCEDSGDDRGDGDDGPDRCHDDGGGRGSRFLVGQLYPLFLDR
jgi:hypothetical protein